MKRVVFLLFVAITALGFFACSEDTPTGNTNTNSFSVSGTAYNNINVICTSISNNYTMNASDLNAGAANCSIAFLGTASPAAGNYTITSGSVTVVVVENSISYAAISGTIAVTLNNGKVKISCSGVVLSKVADPTQTKTLAASFQCS